MLPNFLHIGAAKCASTLSGSGTTSLTLACGYRSLQQGEPLKRSPVFPSVVYSICTFSSIRPRAIPPPATPSPAL